jgi:hypothetical protein
MFGAQDVGTRIEWNRTPELGESEVRERGGEDREVKAVPLPLSLPVLGEEVKGMKSGTGHVRGPVRCG